MPSNRPDRGEWLNVLPGLFLASVIAVAATALGLLEPVLGGPIAAIVLGIAIAPLVAGSQRFASGIAFSARKVLQLSVVVLGTQLSLAQVADVGLSSLPVMLGTLAICLGAAYWIGRWLGVIGDLRTLIGVGTGICGASAVAAVTPVIGAVGADVAYAVSTIFVFNICAVFVFPLIGHMLGMSQDAFGLFAGTAINDTSSVVAAATVYGQQATSVAVVVKLTRTLMIIPIVLALAAWAARRDARTTPASHAAGAGGKESTASKSRVPIVRLIPLFLVGFVLVAAINSLGLIPTDAQPALNDVSVFLITVALAAIGLSTHLSTLRRAGARPLALGGLLWLVAAVSSLALQAITGTL